VTSLFCICEYWRRVRPVTNELCEPELGHFVVMAIHGNASAITRDCIDSRNQTIIISTDILIERSYIKDLYLLWLNYVGFSEHTIEFIKNYLHIIIPHNFITRNFTFFIIYYFHFIIGLFQFFNCYFSLSLSFFLIWLILLSQIITNYIIVKHYTRYQRPYDSESFDSILILNLLLY